MKMKALPALDGLRVLATVDFSYFIQSINEIACIQGKIGR